MYVRVSSYILHKDVNMMLYTRFIRLTPQCYAFTSGAKKLSFTVSPTAYMLMSIATCHENSLIILGGSVFLQARQISHIIALTIWLQAMCSQVFTYYHAMCV